MVQQSIVDRNAWKGEYRSDRKIELLLHCLWETEESPIAIQVVSRRTYSNYVDSFYAYVSKGTKTSLNTNKIYRCKILHKCPTR